MSQLGHITANSLASLNQTQESMGVSVEVTSARPTPEQVVDALLAKLELSEIDRAALRQANGGRDIRDQLVADLRRSSINSAALSYVGGGKYRGYVGLSKQMQQRLIEWSRTDGRTPDETSTGTSGKQQELQAQGALAKHRAELALRKHETRRQVVADVLGTGDAQMAGATMTRHLPKAVPLASEALPALALGTGIIAGGVVMLDKGLELGVEQQMEMVRRAPPLMMSEKQDEQQPIDTAQPTTGAPAIPMDDELPKGELVPAGEAPPTSPTAPEAKDEPSATQPTAPQGEPPQLDLDRGIPTAITAASLGKLAADKIEQGEASGPSRTQPSGAGQLTGRPETIEPADKDAENIRALTRQNETAVTLMMAGFKVEQRPTLTPTDLTKNPELKPIKNPDYRIESEIFDCYSPSTSNARNIASVIERTKVVAGQANRIVLNLDDSHVTLDALRKQLIEHPLPDLKEIIIVKGGKVTHFFPLE